MTPKRKFIRLSKQLALTSVAGFMGLCLNLPAWASDGVIRNIRYDQASRHFVIDASGPIKASVNTLNIAGHKRVIIDLDNAEIGTDLPRDTQLLQDLTRQIPDLKNLTVNQYGGNGRPIVRVLLDIQGDPGSVRLTRNLGPHIELEINSSAAYQAPSANHYQPTRRPDLPPSLAGLSQVQPRPQPTYTPTPAPANVVSSDAVARDMYNRGLSAQQEQQKRIEALQKEVASLNQQLSASSGKTDELNAMKRTLANLNQKYELLQQDNAGLKGKLNTADNAKSEASRLRADLDRLKSENQGLQSKLSQVQNAAAASASSGLSVEEMKRTLAEINRRYDQLNQEKQNLLAENARLKNQTAAKPLVAPTVSEADLSVLRKQLTVAQQSLSESIKTINEQNKELAYLRNQVDTVKSGMNAASREELARLQASQTEKDKTIQDLRRQLEARNSSGSTSATLYASEVKKREEQIAALQKELAAAKSASAQSTPASTSLKEALDKLTQENRQLQDTVKTLKTHQADPNEIQHLQAELDSVRTQAEQARQEANKTKQDLVFLQKSTANAKPSTAGNPALQKQVDELTRQLADARRENTNLKNTMSSQAASSGGKGAASTLEAARHYQAGKASMAAKEMPQAIDAFKQAHLLEPNNSSYVMDYSIALAEERQYAESIDVLRRYIQRNPGDKEAYNQLGKLYLLNDQAESANQAFSRALSVSTLNNYATSLKKLDRMSDAETVFKLALTINPKDSEVLFNLGNLYNAENKLELARNKYLEAIQIKPDFAEAHYNLGLIFSKMGDNTKAVTHLEKFLQLSPNARNAETIRTYVQKLKA